MNKEELQRYLNSKTKSQLIDEIVTLYSQHNTISEHYNSILNHTEQALSERYRKIIHDEFFPENSFEGPTCRIPVVKKAIREFKKETTSPHLHIDLMLYYLEIGIQFTDDYGKIRDSFFSSMITILKQAIGIIHKQKCIDHYVLRLSSIHKKAKTCDIHFQKAIFDTINDRISSFQLKKV